MIKDVRKINLHYELYIINRTANKTFLARVMVLIRVNVYLNASLHDYVVTTGNCTGAVPGNFQSTTKPLETSNSIAFRLGLFIQLYWKC